MARFRWKNVNFLRKTLQLTIVGLLAYMVVLLSTDPSYFPDFEAYCPLGGMQALASFSVSETLACSMTSMQIALGVVVLLGVIVFSKLFCSFICPIGTFTEWLGKLGQKMKMRYTFSGVPDRLLRSLKYALLFLTFYFTVESSELFCRQWDPYYAAFTGFGHDVNALYAWIAIAVVVLGSVFVRQFWCKYLCPLGAATNIFAMLFIPLTVVAAWIVLDAAGITVHWVVPLAVVSALGFFAESIRMKSWVAPFTVIERVDAVCTSCKKCDKACPMGIDISASVKVKHIDCHLCTDCIQVCPDKGALTINKKNWQWFPSFATVALVAGGLWLGSAVEIPTITDKWGSSESFERAELYEQSGLRSVKCFGSSRSFATKMKNVPGVLGVQTFVGTFTVKIWYDPEVISESGVRESMFTPDLEIFSEPQAGDEVAKAAFGVEKLFDSYDHFYFETLLGQLDGVYAVETRFGEPVEAIVYFNPALVDAKQIARQIQSESVTYTQAETEITEKLGFKIDGYGETETMSALEFRRIVFVPEDWKFNGYNEDAAYAIYEIPLPEAVNPALAAEVPYLISHTSDDTGTVRFVTAFDGDVPVARIYFKPDETTPDRIFSHITKPMLHILYDDGDSEDVENKFSFRQAGTVIQPD